MNKKQKNWIIFFVIAAAAAYFSFLTLDIFADVPFIFSGAIKYAGLLCCLVIAILTKGAALDEKDRKLLVSALLITAFADIFLLFTGRKVIGIAVFCFAHLLYIRRYRKNIHRFLPQILFLVLSAVLLLSIWSYDIAVVLAACCYALLILAATFFAFRMRSVRTNKSVICIGMVLFLACDLNVFLFNVLPQTSAIYDLSSILMWTFYLPSQLLLSLSALDFGRFRKKDKRKCHRSLYGTSRIAKGGKRM